MLPRSVLLNWIGSGNNINASKQSVLLNIGTSKIIDKKLSSNNTVEFHFSDDPVWILP